MKKSFIFIIIGIVVISCCGVPMYIIYPIYHKVTPDERLHDVTVLEQNLPTIQEYFDTWCSKIGYQTLIYSSEPGKYCIISRDSYTSLQNDSEYIEMLEKIKKIEIYSISITTKLNYVAKSGQLINHIEFYVEPVCGICNSRTYIYDPYSPIPESIPSDTLYIHIKPLWYERQSDWN